LTPEERRAPLAISHVVGEVTLKIWPTKPEIEVGRSYGEVGFFCDVADLVVCDDLLVYEFFCFGVLIITKCLAIGVSISRLVNGQSMCK
jgi:hypothetical protein